MKVITEVVMKWRAEEEPNNDKNFEEFKAKINDSEELQKMKNGFCDQLKCGFGLNDKNIKNCEIEVNVYIETDK